MRAKVVVVGGGVMGLAIAMNAARRTDPLRDPVVLLERKHLGAGSSGKSGAILRQFYSCSALAGMARDSLQAYAAFSRRTGRSVGFQRTGVLTLAASTTRADAYELERTVALMSSLGIEVSLLDAREVRRTFPGIAVADGTAAAFEPGGGFVDPHLTIDAFAALARTYGAVIRPGQEAEELVFSSGRVVAVETAEERIDCELVVIAAGPWTPRFLTRHGIRNRLSAVRTQQHFVGTSGLVTESGEGAADPFEIAGADEWIRGRTALAQRPEEPLPPASELARGVHPVLLDIEYGFYTRCEPTSRRTRVGRLDYKGEPTVDDPDDYPDEVEPAFSAWARSTLVRRLPFYADRPDLAGETALYTMSPDANAVIGPIERYPGLYVASGFSGHGFKLAPSVGEGVAQMLTGEPVSSFDPEFFSPARFERAEPGAAPRPFGL